MQTDKLQHSRFELKYLIDEKTALQVRDFLRSYLELDSYCAGQPHLSYRNLSLYLDSDDLRLYWATINGNRNRYKLRLRYYNDDPTSPVFFEIKRRVNNVILKERAAVRKSAVREVLAGFLPDEKHLLQPANPEEVGAMNHFFQLMTNLRASPKAHVAYLREAWENHDDNSIRVTLDRTVQSAPHHSGELVTESAAPHLVFGRQVILELKYANRFPRWFQELVGSFDCMQCGAAKFAEGIFAKGEDWIGSGQKSRGVLEEFLTGPDW